MIFEPWWTQAHTHVSKYLSLPQVAICILIALQKFVFVLGKKFHLLLFIFLKLLAIRRAQKQSSPAKCIYSAFTFSSSGLKSYLDLCTLMSNTKYTIRTQTFQLCSRPRVIYFLYLHCLTLRVFRKKQKQTIRCLRYKMILLLCFDNLLPFNQSSDLHLETNFYKNCAFVHKQLLLQVACIRKKWLFSSLVNILSRSDNENVGF